MQDLLTLYVVERWLARLSASPHADKFVLKGGMLLAAFDARRPTVDADALARGFANDRATVVARVVAVAGQQVPDDGVVFRTETVTSRLSRDEELYSGVRVAMQCSIATARVKLQLDWTSTSVTRSRPHHGRSSCQPCAPATADQRAGLSDRDRGPSRVPWSRDLGFSCHGDRLTALELYR